MFELGTLRGFLMYKRLLLTSDEMHLGLCRLPAKEEWPRTTSCHRSWVSCFSRNYIEV